MKRPVVLALAMLVAGMSVSCATPTAMVPTVPPTLVSPAVAPTLTPTPKPEAVAAMINPGDKIGDMVLTIGQGEPVTEIWVFCDPYVTEPGTLTRECQVPALQSLFIGYGTFAGTTEELDAVWKATPWELILDNQAVNLVAFDTLDQDDDIDGPVKVRLWNLVLEQPTPGIHTLRYIFNEYGKPYDVTWAFTVASPATMAIPAGAESLPFAGVSSGFSTLAEFSNLMQSAIAGGKVDSFWKTVGASAQMPLIFGDEIAVFLYRGQASSVALRGDFNAQFVRQGATDLWALMRQFEPDARVEYKILLNSSEYVLDPMNPLTETGGLGTNSVVRMPEYVIPEPALPRDDIVHGTLSENIALSSRILGYNVNYRVYTPAGYATLEDLPVIYVTDGQDYANPGMGAMVNVMDSLIAGKRIKPVIGVFVDPRDPTSGDNRREQELKPESLDTCPFCNFVAEELVQAVDTAYKTDPSPDARAILGFSLGGMFAAHIGLAASDRFHQIAIQSPDISGEWIYDTYEQAEQLPLQVFLSHGTYDVRAGSPRLRDILKERGYPLLYIETHEGHSYGNVRGLLDDMLIFFYPPKNE